MAGKKRCVYDVEANGFLLAVTTFWCAGIIDVDTKEEFWFRPTQLKEFLEKLDTFDIRAAHHGSGYDEKALEKLAKLYGFTWVADIDKHADTLVMSQVLNYNRFGNKDAKYKAYLNSREEQKLKGIKPHKLVMGEGHSLARWGISLDDYKGEHTDFSQFSEEMFDYMKQDVRLNLKIYLVLIGEILRWISKTGSHKIVRAIQIETDVNRVTAEQHINGWLLDKEKLPETLEKLQTRMEEISSEVNPLLGFVLRKSAGDKNSKHGEYVKSEFVTKSGKYASWLNKWFDWPEETGASSRKVVGEFCRVSFEKADIGSPDDVKKYLYKIGWVPDEWNGKWEGEGRERHWKRTSAKITESSLEHLEGAGPINEFYTLRSRKSIIEGWSEHIDDQGRLHGDAFNIGTPTFRQTHSIIVNLPSAKATLGPEVRSLFITEPGWSVVSADSAACQLRLLSHYMKDEDFLRELLDGDMHQKNADILTKAACESLHDTTIRVSRSNAKPFNWRLRWETTFRKLCEFRETLKETILSEARRKHGPV
jgi:DNA polymerase I-like protein with 3'-5' exonuclease and polymerase domains